MKALFQAVRSKVCSRFEQVLQAVRPIANLEDLTRVDGASVEIPDMHTEGPNRYMTHIFLENDANGWSVKLAVRTTRDDKLIADEKIHSCSSFEDGIIKLEKECNTVSSEVNLINGLTTMGHPQQIFKKASGPHSLSAVKRALAKRATEVKALNAMFKL